MAVAQFYSETGPHGTERERRARQGTQPLLWLSCPVAVEWPRFPTRTGEAYVFTRDICVHMCILQELDTLAHLFIVDRVWKIKCEKGRSDRGRGPPLQALSLRFRILR